MIFTDRYPPFWVGGYEIGCREIAGALKEKGHEVSVITTKYGLRDERPELGVYRILGYCDINALKDKKTYLLTQLKRAAMYRRNAAIVEKIVSEIKPDILYGFHMWDIGLLAVKKAQKSGIPFIFDLQDYWLSEYKYQLVLREKGLPRVMAAIMNGIYDFSELDFRYLYAISETLKRVYADSGFDREMRVIPRGIRRKDVVSIERLPDKKDLPQRALKIIYAGRLAEEKGPDVAIRAFGILAKKLKGLEIRLSIAGAGEKGYEEYLRKQADATGFARGIKFLGVLNRGELLAEHKRNDILFFPSLWLEPLGVTVLEAMSCGLPVIASRKGGPAEIISDGEDGILVEPGDPAAMAEAAERLLKDPFLYNEIRENGCRTVKSRFGLDEIAGRIENYLFEARARTR